MSVSTSLLPLVHRYIEDDPAAAARKLEAITEEEALGVAVALPPALLARVVPHLQVGYAATLLRDTAPEVFKEVATKLDTKRAATIFMRLPKDVQKRFLPTVGRKLKTQIRELLTYPQGSVGQIMTTEWVSVRKDRKVRDTISKIRELAKKRVPASYAYVVGEDDHLVGVINMRDLLVAAPEDPVEAVMRRDVFKIHCFTDVSEAAAELSKRKYFAAPVVDGEDRMLGVIRAEQLIQGVQQDAARDIQKMFGAGGDGAGVLSDCFLAAKAASLASRQSRHGLSGRWRRLAIRGHHRQDHDPRGVLARGGRPGRKRRSQSLAIVMRGLVMREIPREKTARLVLKEGGLGLITGLITGLVTAVVAWLWQGNPFLGVVIGLGMIVNLFFAGLSGAAIPIVMRAVGLDPAQCSSIILTTVTDVIGFFAFLGFAVLFQSHLV